MPNRIIKFDELNSLIETVSEEINESSLFMFTKTVFQKKHQNFDKNYKIIPSYLHHTNEYFIIYYKNKKEQTIEFEYFQDYLDDNSNSLIICEDYFFLFEKRKFYYYQKTNQDIKKDEIKEFVNKRFNFKIDKSILVNKEDLEKLKEKTENKNITSSLKYLKKSINLNIFYFYFLLVLFSPLLFGFYLKYKNDLDYNHKISSLENIIQKKVMIKKEDFLYTKVAKLFENLADKKISLVKIDYRNSKVNLLIKSKRKDNLYSFFKLCKKLLVNSIVYKKKENSYESNISFVL